MAGKSSKTNVTGRSKTGRETEHSCFNCNQPILNDREMVVVMDGRRRNKTFHHRTCFQKSVGA